MLKSYAGEKIIQIMKKTMVEFVSVVSSVYHCLLFQDPPLVMSDGGPREPVLDYKQSIVCGCLLQA